MENYTFIFYISLEWIGLYIYVSSSSFVLWFIPRECWIIKLFKMKKKEDKFLLRSATFSFLLRSQFNILKKYIKS